MVSTPNDTKSKVKRAKEEVIKMLSAGLASDFIAKQTGLSPNLIRDWEEEYLKDILANGAGQRARIRNLLLRNAPQMINVLYKQAIQEVDPKLQSQAATTFLNFATRFIREDASIAASEARANKAASGSINNTLFDFVIPGELNPQEPEVADEAMEGFFGGSEGEVEDEDYEVTPDDLLDYGSSE